MIKKRFIMAVISFVLIVAVIFCSSLSAFAYHPTVGISSSDWYITSDETYKEVYPNNKHGFVFNDSALKHDYLNGETYFVSRYWNDEGYHRVSKHEFSPPKLTGSWWRSGDNYGSEAKHIIFEVGNTFYMAIFYGFNSVYVTDESYHSQLDLQFDVSCKDGEVDFYKISYPFTSWQFVKYTDYYGSVDIVSFANGSTISDVFLWYSDVDIYNYKGDKIVKSADKVNYTNFVYPVNYSSPVAVLEGSVSFTIDNTMLQKLSYGSFAMIVENVGFVSAMETGIVNICVTAKGIVNGKEEFRSDMVLYSYDVLVDDFDIEVGKDYMYSELGFVDFDYEVRDDIDLVFDFSFLTDSYNLFFPGNITFVEFESYEDDMEHDEVMNAIDEAAGLIDGSIKNASSELSQEIASAADSIVSNSNENTAIVTSKIDESTKNITDKLEDVGDKVENKLEDVKDSITDKLEDTKTGILDGIKSFFIPSDVVMDEIDNKWDELLKSRFGALYEVSDIITDFASQMSWDYIKQAGEKNTITMPSVTVKLVDTDFTFGGYEVSIIPEGFDVLTTALKGITSIVCTLLFVNALRRKYDKLVGGAAA